MKIIELSQNQSAIVDDEDFNLISSHKWRAQWNENTRSYYAISTDDDGNTLRMHRLVAKETNPKRPVDHINHNTLDNTRGNLRSVTVRQNASNRRDQVEGRCTSKYVGVSFDSNRNKWRASIMVDGKRKQLGRFKTEIEAHLAYQTELSKIGEETL